jgi:hypothetical protein
MRYLDALRLKAAAGILQSAAHARISLGERFGGEKSGQRCRNKQSENP